jgi:hypothetical protein
MNDSLPLSIAAATLAPALAFAALMRMLIEFLP